MSSRPLSIVMPAYNEGAHIERVVREWHDVVLRQIAGAEIIVVNDASTDDTDARLRGLCAEIEGLRVLSLPTNVGHGRAVVAGLDAADGEFVFQTDSDRQHLPVDFWRLWERRADADFVFGVRERRADGLFRLFVSATLRVVNRLLFGLAIADANCPFKLMRREPLRALLAEIPPGRFIPMVMVAVLARRRGYAVVDVCVTHLPRLAGHQSLAGMVRWAQVGWRCVGELVAFRRMAAKHAPVSARTARS